MEGKEEESGCVKVSIDSSDTVFYFKLDNKFAKKALCYALTVLTSLLGLVGINTSLTKRDYTPETTEVPK
jgi:hypothetical protein